MKIQQFEPGNKWTEADGTLTTRAKGYLRSLFAFIGADTGTTPVGSLGGDGTTADRFYREDGTFASIDAADLGGDGTSTTRFYREDGVFAEIPPDDMQVVLAVRVFSG